MSHIVTIPEDHPMFQLAMEIGSYGVYEILLAIDDEIEMHVKISQSQTAERCVTCNKCRPCSCDFTES